MKKAIQINDSLEAWFSGVISFFYKRRKIWYVKLKNLEVTTPAYFFLVKVLGDNVPKDLQILLDGSMAHLSEDAIKILIGKSFSDVKVYIKTWFSK